MKAKFEDRCGPSVVSNEALIFLSCFTFQCILPPYRIQYLYPAAYYLVQRQAQRENSLELLRVHLLCRDIY